MNKSIINSYRLNPTPTQRPPTPGVIAGRIVPAVAPTNYRRLVVLAAVILLPVLAIGVVVYAARAVQPAPVAVPSPGVVERVVEATPVVVVVTATPQAVQVAPVAPARQAVVSQAPTPRPQPTPTPERQIAAAIVAPSPQPQAPARDDWRPSDLLSPRPFRCADGTLWSVGGWGYLIEPTGINAPWRVVEDNGTRHTNCHREG